MNAFMQQLASQSTQPTAVEVAEALQRVLPGLDADGERLSLALYRQLAEGSPVAIPRLAAGLGLSASDVTRRLQDWPGVYYDDQRSVIGYWGLTIRPITRHRLRVDGRELYAWCAWDTLFLPALLGRTAEVSSPCRGSGEPVRLAVSPHGIESATPRDMFVSFVTPDPEAVRTDVIANLCHYIHFFRSTEAARPWLAQQSGGFLLTLAEAYEVGERRNRARYRALS